MKGDQSYGLASQIGQVGTFSCGAPEPMWEGDETSALP